ncbi:MAG TPA: hypothetical protein VF774_29030 [Pseudoduganella sp.]
MGYWSDAIIDCETITLEEARELAAAIVDWLVDARIIENRQCDQCHQRNRKRHGNLGTSHHRP